MSVTEMRRDDAGTARMPPHDLGAEQCTLGGMLLSADAITDVLKFAESRDFFRPGNQLIFEAVTHLFSEGLPADPVTVGHLLTKRGQIQQAGGLLALHDAIAAVPTAANAGHYARIVRDRAILRRLAETGTRITQMGCEAAGEAADIAQRAQDMLADAVTSATAGTTRTFREILGDAIASLESQRPRGLSLPWRDLDDALLGLVPGQLILVAARPSIGKSVVITGIAAHTAVTLGKPVLLSSAEMAEEEITFRMLSAYTKIPLHNLLARQITGADWERIAATYDKIAGCPLILDDTPGPSLAHIRGKLREMARTAPAELLVVDYLQLLSAARAESRQVAVADLSWGLRQLGRENNIPVVVATQLNRNPEHRHDKRPQLADLRESGALEMNADVVVLLNRDDFYEPESPRAGEIDLIIAKNRQGPLGTVTAAFQGHYSRVVDMARDGDDNWSPSAQAVS
jgi:replicative DNA helicase